MKRTIETHDRNPKRTCITQDSSPERRSENSKAVGGVGGLQSKLMDTTVQEAIDSGLLVTYTTQSEVLLRCEACKCEMKGAVPAASHLRGSKHQKAYKRYLAQLSDENGTSVLDDNKHRDHFVAEDVTPELRALVKEGILEEFVHNGYLHFRCTLCYCDMSGSVPTISHINGGSHNKKLNATQNRQGVGSSSFLSSTHCTSSSGMNSNISSACSTPQCGSLTDLDSGHSTPLKPAQMVPRFGLDNTSSPAAGGVAAGDSLRLENLSSGVLRAVFYMGAQHYECTVCGIPVTGDIPAVSHLQGKSHNKAVTRKGLLRDPQKLVMASSGSSLSLSSTDGDSQQGNVAHVIHSVSSINLSDDDVTAALAAGVLARELSGGVEFFKCNVCESASLMSGYATASSHLLGQRHHKNMARLNISSAPTVATHDTSSSSVGNDAYERALREGALCQLSSGAFQCLVCKITVTGIRSAEQHLIGGPHIHRLIKWRENREQVLNGANSNGSRNGTSSHLVSEVDAGDADFHDASSSFSTAEDNSSSGSSSSSSRARAEEVTTAGSQFEIMKIGLGDEVDLKI